MAVCDLQKASIRREGASLEVSLEVCIDFPADGTSMSDIEPMMVNGGGTAVRAGRGDIIVRFNGQARSHSAPIR